MSRTRTLSCALALGATLAGCGGRQGLDQPEDQPEDDGGVGAAAGATIGPVDFSQAPSQIAMTCDHGVGQIAFANPCEVGFNLNSPASTAPGFHEIECHFAGQGAPIVWSFILPLVQIAQNPDAALQVPGGVAQSPTPRALVDLGGQQGEVSSVVGVMTFSRVDPTGRAFSGHFTGTVTWKASISGTISCVVDSPFWGEPASFV